MHPGKVSAHFVVDSDSPVPAHAQLKSQIKLARSYVELEPGDVLPSDPGATGDELQHGGRGDGESAPAFTRRGHRLGGRADTRLGERQGGPRANRASDYYCKIYLPQLAEAVSTDRPGPTVVSSSGTETILLVEDSEGLRQLATRFLERAGYTVLGAATGEKALGLLERHEDPVDLLLSDVVMPGMSGRLLAERLAQSRRGMKVLYMSGYTDDTIVRHGVLEAQVSFLAKPFNAAALLRKVREVLDAQA